MNAEATAKRLQDATTKCLASLQAWTNDLKNDTARENLLEAVHELRRVTSRLEIDIAMNDRKAVNSKPLPIPEHKSKTEKKSHKPLSEILPVAELREAGEKRRKIAIKEAEAETTEGEEENESASDNGSNSDESPKKSRRPRRKKREDNDSSED